LYILYKDLKRDVSRTTTDQFLKALVKLLVLGFSECITKEKEQWQICSDMNLVKLRERLAFDMTDQRLLFDPFQIDDIYFKITPQGRIEEKKKIYDSYYP
jgi:hypothetical protein